MLWNTRKKILLSDVSTCDEAILVRKCAWHLNLEGKLAPMQDALLTFSSKPAFSKLYQAIAAEFSRVEWIHQIRELVAKKMRLKYRKMTITPEDIDAATGMLIVQG